MSPDRGSELSKREALFAREVARKASRKLKSQREDGAVWFGLGMSGMVGWSVTVPTLLGGLFGAWLDRRYPGGHSWSLTLMSVGLVFGCSNAWHWLSRENETIREKSSDRDG